MNEVQPQSAGGSLRSTPATRPASLYRQRGRSLGLSVPRREPGNQKCTHRGTTLIECIVATVLVGALMVAALRSAGSAMRTTVNIDDRTKGQRLAGDLMNEILTQAYQEPGGSGSLGMDSGENTGNRSLFDDVDDYAGWSGSPPTDKTGAALDGCTGWTRSVSVIWADPTTLGTTASQNTGLKKITVSVTKSGTTLASITGYRTIAWVDTIPTPTDATSNTAPVAVASASGGTTKTHGQSVTFLGTSSTDADGDYLSYVWDFADGSTATGSSVTHVFATAGTYQVKLTVYDGNGGVGIAYVTMTIT